MHACLWSSLELKGVQDHDGRLQVFNLLQLVQRDSEIQQ
jgi:hypothetical protein